jgi:phage terminase large subunit
MGVDCDNNIFVIEEFCRAGLTLSEAAVKIAELCRGHSPEYAVASPDLWNRGQDSGRSGFEIMQSTPGMPPMVSADNRRIPGWRVLREHLAKNDSPNIFIASSCHTLIRSLPALMFDSEKSEDAGSEPHSVTHAPEALRYGVMSRYLPPSPQKSSPAFHFRRAPDVISEYLKL